MNRATRAVPICIDPVGDGATRVTTGRSADIEVPIATVGRVAGAGAARPSKGWPSIMRRLRVPSPREWLECFRAEIARQEGRATLWVPVAFGCGAALYLNLKFEPPLWAAVVFAALSALPLAGALALKSTRVPLAPLLLAGLVGGGFLAAKVHTMRVAAPIAPARGGVATIKGWVTDIDTPSERGERLIIAPAWVSGLPPEATPTRVRIVLAAPGGPDAAPPPGTPIEVVALLDPPPGPAAPGAYDFARDAWFEGLGGVGLSMRDPVITYLPDPPWPVRMEMAMNATRWKIAKGLAHDIHSVLGADDGGAAGLAAAVTTSHQDWLAADHRDDLRASGLAHMLAIAGLHTAALTGFAFFFVRLLVAACPWLALRVSGKKVAALTAILVVVGYLMLSGAHPPARRAAITATVAFLAILFDRRAVSLHSLAIAAFAILVLEPEAVLQPGFEMSFCATGALVALAEIWRRPKATSGGLAWPLVALQKGRDWLIAMAVVSIVAGAATAPFSIQYFNRVANYGVFANLAADFVASAVLMPALGLALLAQVAGVGEGMGSPVNWIAGMAAKGIVAIAHLFAEAPGAAMNVPSAPDMALALSYSGIIFVCLWRGRLRWAGAPLAAAVALWPRPAPPVAWIAADGDDAAVVVAGAELPMKPGARLYATQLWAQRRGFTLASSRTGAESPAFVCDRKGCLPAGPARPALAASWMRKAPSDERFETLCDGADFVILRSLTAPNRPCGHATVLTRADFERFGAAEIYPSAHGWRLVWSQQMRGHRPWAGGADPIDSVG